MGQKNINGANLEKLRQTFNPEREKIYGKSFLEAINKSTNQELDVIEDENSQELDELFYDALEIITAMQTVSVSELQRRFRIGYMRAANIIDQLEEQGYIGPSDDSVPRKFFSKNK